MVLLAFLTLFTLPAVTHQLAVSSAQSLETTELAAEANADRTFSGASGLLETLEADVAHIWKVLHGSHSSTAFVQLTSELSSAPVAAKTAPHKKGMDAMTAVKEMDKLKPGQMTPMLGLLTGMYDSWKEKIGECNKREKDQKTVFEKTIQDLEKKKAADHGSKDANDTYDRIEKYWKKQRSISHRQYHTALKIMHSGMQKFKAVSSAMSAAIAGKKPTAKDLQTVGLAMPDVVLLQVQQLAAWTQEASPDLHGAKAVTA
jgi:hypothetical protein